MLFRNNVVPESGAARGEGNGSAPLGWPASPASWRLFPRMWRMRQLRWASGTLRRQAAPGWD